MTFYENIIGLENKYLNDNIYTRIYYHTRETYAQQIANLVKVIGQEELVRRTSGSTKMIEFCLQQDMVERKTKG